MEKPMGTKPPLLPPCYTHVHNIWLDFLQLLTRVIFNHEMYEILSF